jgi:hypothetical protein
MKNWVENKQKIHKHIQGRVVVFRSLWLNVSSYSECYGIHNQSELWF